MRDGTDAGREQVVVLSRAGRDSVPSRYRARLAALADVHHEVCRVAPQPREAARLLAGATVLGATNIALPVLDEALLDTSTHLRSVVLYATGYDHVDVDLLARRGITLSVLPEYATRAVAEQALALVFALSTRLHLANDRARGLAPESVSLRGMELTGRTVGVVGAGRIGSEVVRMFRGLGMRVLACDLDEGVQTRLRAGGVPVLGHEDLVRASDVVVLCASTIPGAGPILDDRRLDMLEPDALVVNVGRPGLVDTPAILGRLRARSLRGYAVDEVVATPAADADLLDEGRLLQSAHSAWWKDEVLERGAEMFGAALLDATLGTPRDVVVAAAGQRAGRAAA